MLSLHNLKKSKGIERKKARLGRGNATGTGNYSTRGMKGQRSRSGGKSGLALRSIKSYLLGIPKVRGFKSPNKTRNVINICDLEKNFSEGDIVNIRSILKVGLIETIGNGIKILSDGELSKNLIIEANAFSAGAKKKIEAAGGKAIVTTVKKQENKKDNKKSLTTEEVTDKKDKGEENK